MWALTSCNAKKIIFQGLPNTFGGYDETPEVTAKHIKVYSIYCESVIINVLVDNNSLLILDAYSLQYSVSFPLLALYVILIVYRQFTEW